VIVSEYFKGDDVKFQWIQHASYSLAINKIMSISRKMRVDNLRKIKRDDNMCPEDLKMLERNIDKIESSSGFDHRHVQYFHDRLAAYWRKRFYNPKDSEENNIKQWLRWLEHTITYDVNRYMLMSVSDFLEDSGSNTKNYPVIEKMINSYVVKYYPLSLRDRLKKIDIEEFGMNAVIIASVTGFADLLINGFIVYKTNSLASELMAIIISIIFIYYNNEKLHRLCMKSVFLFILSLFGIYIASLSICFIFLIEYVPYINLIPYAIYIGLGGSFIVSSIKMFLPR